MTDLPEFWNDENLEAMLVLAFLSSFMFTFSGAGMILNVTIGAVFEPSEYERFRGIFKQTINEQSSVNLNIRGWAIPSMENLHDNIQGLCSFISSNNVIAFIVFGSRDTINSVSLVTETLGIPVLGYVTDKKDLHQRVHNRFHVQMEHSMTHMAIGIMQFFNANFWFEFLVFIEDTFLYDGLYEEIKNQTKSGRWRPHIVPLSPDMTYSVLNNSIMAAINNQDRIILLHVSAQFALRIFKVVQESETTVTIGWFLTETVYTRNLSVLNFYPLGSLVLLMNEATDMTDLLRDSVSVVVEAFRGCSKNERLIARVQTNCENPGPVNIYSGSVFYNKILGTTYDGLTGHVKFDSDGTLLTTSFRIRGLVQEGRHQTWQDVGFIREEEVRPFGILWPFEQISSHMNNGKIRYRIVTNPVKPFVIDEEPNEDYSGECTLDTICLKIEADVTDKESTLRILRDYENGIVNRSNPYKIHCCRGLAIDLLNRLASDLDFSYTLYIVHDTTYGKDDNNGSWNGMVEDLMEGTAHMAVAAFSITRSRMKAIDFTYPYYFSRFTILYSEQNPKTHFLAFLEPFAYVVWLGILISATVSAISMAVFEWNSPFGLNPWGRKRKQNYTLASGLTMVWSIICGHTVKTKSPKSWPSKVMQNFWAFACIFIIASYTANLAAFIAGKHTGINYNDIFDSRLLQIRVGVLGGSAVESLVRNISSRLFRASQHHLVPTSDQAIEMLIKRNLDAYLGDYPILDFARVKLDPECKLRILSQSFGEDGYGIGLPKGSPLKVPLSDKIKEYHRKGYIEDLIDIHFDEEQCFGQRITTEGFRLEVTHHAGLFLCLSLGIIIGIGLVIVEYAVFRWVVPFIRSKPTGSRWRSLHIMFLSQRLHRIITSEVLIGAHESAKEMIGIVRNREFARLFQKSTIRRNKLADMAKTKRLNRNFLDIVEKAKWMQEMRNNNLFGDDSPTNGDIPCITEISLKELSSNIDFDALKSQTQDCETSSVDDLDEDEENSKNGEAEKKKWCLSEVVVGEDNVCPRARNRRHTTKAERTECEVPLLAKVRKRSDITGLRSSGEFPLDSNVISSNDSDFSGLKTNSIVPNGNIVHSCDPVSEMRAISSNQLTHERKSKYDGQHLCQSNPRKTSLPLNQRHRNHLKRKSLMITKCEREALTSLNYNDITKDDLLLMWRASDTELNNLLDEALRDKAQLEEKLAQINELQAKGTEV